MSKPITKPGPVHGMSDELILIPVGKHHHALVDSADLALVNDRAWQLLCGHRDKLYAYAKGEYMHRLIAETAPGYETDHVNGDGLDNRRSNLRPATASQNRANMGKPRRPDGLSHTSQFKGVSWDKDRGRWQSKITVLGKCRNLGRYDAEADAARAYDRAAFEAWGEFAVLNLLAAGDMV